MPEVTRVIRPAAILREAEAVRLQKVLEDEDVSRGGVWNATAGVWQRYDKRWDGVGGLAGSAKLMGTIGVVYGSPSKYEITIYRVTVTSAGAELGWTVESLCDDALKHVGMSLDLLPRAEMPTPPSADPFHKPGS